MYSQGDAFEEYAAIVQIYGIAAAEDGLVMFQLKSVGRNGMDGIKRYKTQTDASLDEEEMAEMRKAS